MYLITQLIECNDCREVDRIVEKNLLSIPANQRSKLCQYANTSKRRIVRVNREKKKSFENLMN